MRRLKPAVLAIDDDPIFRKIYDAVLSRLGMTVKSVATEKEFMEVAEKLNPDLCLIDLKLEGGTGFDVIRKMKEASMTAWIVVVSGSQDKADLAHAFELGASDFILKPLDKTLLASKLSRFVTSTELEEQSSKFQNIPEGKIDAKLHLSVDLEEIDELGVKMLNKNLIPKGTVLKLNSEVFSKMGHTSSEVLVTVTNTWFDAETQIYGAYAEFDGVGPEFLQLVRKWLAEK